MFDSNCLYFAYTSRGRVVHWLGVLGSIPERAKLLTPFLTAFWFQKQTLCFLGSQFHETFIFYSVLSLIWFFQALFKQILSAPLQLKQRLAKSHYSMEVSLSQLRSNHARFGFISFGARLSLLFGLLIVS